MNNYTTARAPLRQSENSHLLMLRILDGAEPKSEEAATPMPPYIDPPAPGEPIQLKKLRKAKVKKNDAP